MKKRNFTTILFLALIIGLSASCSKDGEDGAVGPQGEQGIQGEQGPQGNPGQDGADGAQGEQGDPGTANVIYSEWFTADFGETPITEPLRSFAVLNVNDLSQEIKDTGLILMYTRKDLGAGYTYFTLPHTVYSQHQFYYVKAFDYNDRLNITLETTDDSDIWSPYFTEFRYVIVPGGTLASKSDQGLEKMSYQEIIERFHLPE